MTGTEDALLRAVLPPWACGAARGADAPPDELHAAETPGEGAGPRRRAEFAAGRWCAHRALTALCGASPAVPRGPRGAPVWPPGVVGSITHCAGFRAAAVCRSRDARGLGLDAEPAAPLPARVRTRLLTPREDALVAALRLRLPGLPADRLLFSAREAAYKAWPVSWGQPPPLRGLSVEEITVRPADPTTGRCTIRLPDGYAPPDGHGPRHRCAPPGGGVLHGRWHAAAGLLVACVVVAPGCRPDRTAAGGGQGRSGCASST
ncbi:4'-phosphopantetheinyl transferase family protein [Streptomyces capoamus]|uniref:4'-phosphopantetheinyl transferase family protein n=1 Tax=Streptomyces capoamus TaxID=68183 RepID=UPI003C2D8AF8